jgi:hypothetical protein
MYVYSCTCTAVHVLPEVRKYESTSVLESPGFGFGLRPLHVQYSTCTRTTDNALPSKVRKYNYFRILFPEVHK